MVLCPQSEIRDVTGITEEEKLRIRDFLQGQVYAWCNATPDEWFSARGLLGFDWSGTPMIVLFEKHIRQGKTQKQAIDAAGKDAGWLLKSVIDCDRRLFETKGANLIRNYRWIRKSISEIPNSHKIPSSIPDKEM